MKHDFKKQVRSFGYAWNGLKTCIGQEQHLDFLLLAAVAVTVCGWLLGISRMEWIAVTLCIGMVIAAELFNTAVETLTDLVSPEWNALAGKTKDIAAGAVLVTAITAAVVGLIVFTPYVARLLAIS